MKRENGVGASTSDARGKRAAVIAARFYVELTDQLVDGARRALLAAGMRDADIVVYDVDGCFELPLACQRAIDIDDVDLCVAVGVVIRGDTPHFDFVAGECARGIMDVQLKTRVPIGFGVLTTETLSQAAERADPARGDKGREAAQAALSILRIGESGTSRAGFRT